MPRLVRSVVESARQLGADVLLTLVSRLPELTPALVRARGDERPRAVRRSH